RVGLEDLQFRLAAAAEVFGQRFNGLVGGVKSTSGLPTRRRHQRVVVSVADEREVPADVSADERGGRFRRLLDEAGELLVGDIALAHLLIPPGPRACSM